MQSDDQREHADGRFIMGVVFFAPALAIGEVIRAEPQVEVHASSLSTVNLGPLLSSSSMVQSSLFLQRKSSPSLTGRPLRVHVNIRRPHHKFAIMPQPLRVP